MKSFFQAVKFVLEFDLASIFRNIALPFVFVYVSYFYLIDLISGADFELPKVELPRPTISPLFILSEEFQSETVKSLRSINKFPRNYKKQDMINALLVTN